MADDSSYSNFVASEPVAVSHDYTGFSKVAEGAYCTLWRACKDGQWVVVKALKPPYRGCAQYEMLLRIMTLVLVAVLLISSGFVAYHEMMTPRPQFEVVARFQYSNMIFESWGGGVATMRPAIQGERTVEVPAAVVYNGFKYKVDEVTFHAFQGDGYLQAVIMPGGIHIMEDAFRDCPHLTDLYIKGAPPSIGNAQWPTEIDKVFDVAHFSTVRIHVPKTCRAAYAASPWNRFKRYVYF